MSEINRLDPALQGQTGSEGLSGATQETSEVGQGITEGCQDVTEEEQEKKEVRIYLAYFQSLLRHKWFVVRAGLSVGGIPLWRLILHDWSKFALAEAVPYAQWHFGDSKNKRKWAVAWHHHQLLNPHHPEHWLLSWRGAPDFYDGVGEFVADGVVVLPMPEVFVREMVADFLASSRTYTGCWNIADWLNENGPKMILHSETVGLIAVVMHELGYVAADNCDWSWLKSCESEARLERK